MNDERPLEVHEEAALDAELGRLRRAYQSPARSAATNDPLVRVVTALRTFDHAESCVVERHVDALYEAHATTTRSRGLLDFVVHKIERSTLAKILAASIVAHILALPVLAYMLLTPSKSKAPVISFAPVERFDAPTREEPEELLGLADAFNQALLADRAKLAEFSVLPAATPRADGVYDTVEELLWQRLELWSSTPTERARETTKAHRTLIEWGAQTAAVDRDSLVGDTVRLELALDILASSPAGRAFVERHVAGRIAELAALASSTDEGVAGLLHAGLDRATAYGLGGDTDLGLGGLDVAAWIQLVRVAHPDPLPIDLIAAFERYAQASGH